MEEAIYVKVPINRISLSFESWTLVLKVQQLISIQRRTEQWNSGTVGTTSTHKVLAAQSNWFMRYMVNSINKVPATNYALPINEWIIMHHGTCQTLNQQKSVCHKDHETCLSKKR